jgi:2-polyprenyl-6-methoxyphenol hydroxylase-like FAD-dependent oxidoreductase
LKNNEKPGNLADRTFYFAFTICSDNMATECETTDVLIVGAGPTGDLLSASLAMLSIKNIVLEKELQVWPYPRALIIGEDGLRALQGVGIGDDIYTRIAASKFISKDIHNGPNWIYHRSSWSSTQSCWRQSF